MTTYTHFGATTTATEVASTFSSQVRGKTILIVGVSPNSLGQHLVQALVPHNPYLLILASRSLKNIDSVTSSLSENEKKMVKAVEVDLSSQSSIRLAANAIKGLTEKLDLVFNVAAVNVQEKEMTEDGLEMHFGTNYIGFFLLTNLLIPEIRNAAREKGKTAGETRIVSFTSAGHRLSPIRFSDLNFSKPSSDLPEEERPPQGLPKAVYDPEKGGYSSFVAYAQSKTGNILFSVALRERFKKEGILAISVHPGCECFSIPSMWFYFKGLESKVVANRMADFREAIWTNLARNLDEEGKEVIKNTSKAWKTRDQGAATGLVAGLDPALGETEEVYMSDCQFAKAASFATDVSISERLWGVSEQLVGQRFIF
ncbi:hypothetical protein HYFRA_00005404 [Hymenoscyphus fraxineus]|uniref:Short-chain dehydrogenase n=1 Tax=Hymenoscyphus fraxineus TaxID=746836 RepID=A0A9N9Q0P3_9HELO|nr:hypothetical protein HYFRA_00005404 [Hymenoscyphus fraxineus]